MSFQDICYRQDPFPPTEIEQLHDRIWALEGQRDSWRWTIEKGDVAEDIGTRIIARISEEITQIHGRIAELEAADETYDHVPF